VYAEGLKSIEQFVSLIVGSRREGGQKKKRFKFISGAGNGLLKRQVRKKNLGSLVKTGLHEGNEGLEKKKKKEEEKKDP